MHALSDPIKEVRPAAMACLTDLETALVAHGFTVEVEVKFWALTATARADKLSPSRSVRVQLAANSRGTLDWYRKPPGADDVELLCPADAIAEAVELISRALSLASR